MNTDRDAIIDKAIMLLQSAKSEPETLEDGAAPEVSESGRPLSSLADKGWLSVEEAAAWIGRSHKYIRKKLRERRLWCQRLPGRGGGELRIPKAHLDEQMALGFPVLKIPPRALERLDAERAAAKLLREARPLKDIIPGPERDESKQPPQRVY